MRSLIKELIDRCIQLAQFSEKRRENIVTTEVDPLLKVFSQVHDACLKRLVDLQQAVLKHPEQHKGGKVFKKFMRESVLSSSQGQQLENTIKTIKHPEIKNLIKAILQYLRPKELSADRGRVMAGKEYVEWDNLIGTSLIYKLHRALLKSQDKKDEIHRLLDQIEGAIMQQLSRRRKVMLQYFLVHKALRG